jgi:hypothetical protein
MSKVILQAAVLPEALLPLLPLQLLPRPLEPAFLHLFELFEALQTVHLNQQIAIGVNVHAKPLYLLLIMRNQRDPEEETDFQLPGELTG